jgi:hypothetical protein
VCRGDEDAAQMRSFVQHRTTLGSDDEDAVRWIYGDAGPQTVVTIPPGTASGNYYVLAVADADNTVAESNENNNVTAKPLTISP